MQAVEARASVRDRLRLAGADERLGGVNRFRSIADVLDGETGVGVNDLRDTTTVRDDGAVATATAT